MFQMCETLFSTGKVVLVDSGFCVENRIVSLPAKGLYPGAIIKKLLYWPKSVPGDLKYRYFSDKDMGDAEILEAATEHGYPFHILYFKELD